VKHYKNLFGSTPSKEDIEKYNASPNWKDGKFQNLETTNLGLNYWDLSEQIFKQFKDKENREPKFPLEIEKFNLNEFLNDATSFKFCWFGHSVILIRLEGKTILIDPMLGPDASPIAPFKTKRFSENTLDLIDNFPDIDLMLLSHDHYDHIDYASILKLKSKTKLYYVALGVKRHLAGWDIEKDKIIEFDWWDKQVFENIEIHFTPTRHFSGRGITDRAKSLWGGWTILSNENKICFSGDGGYGQHFKSIGEKFGAYDFAFMECGQYNTAWKNIHLLPEQSVNAALDLKAKKVMPVHWAAFTLSPYHKWYEPADQFIHYCNEKSLDYISPKLGALVHPDTHINSNWWKL